MSAIVISGWGGGKCLAADVRVEGQVSGHGPSRQVVSETQLRITRLAERERASDNEIIGSTQ